MSSEDWQFLHRETSNTIFLQWQTPNISRRCANGYIVKTLQNGRKIHQSRIDYSFTNYTIPNLKSCHNYSVELSVIDHSDVAILNYESVNVTTQISGMVHYYKIKVIYIFISIDSKTFPPKMFIKAYFN